MRKITEKNYPIKKARDMSDEEYSNWWAFMESLRLIYKHADRYDIDIEDVNLDSRKIIKEYVTPMSGDIQHKIGVQGREHFVL